MIFLFGILFFLAQGQLYDPNMFTLGSNLVVNPTFSTPNIGSSLTAFYGTSILGWSCTTDCQIVNVPVLCSTFGVSCSNNYTQGIDMDSVNILELLKQSISITTAGDYLLRVEYMDAVVSPVGKKMRVTLNGTTLSNITCLVAAYTYKKVEHIVSLAVGSVSVELQMFGTTPDTKGFITTGVYLQRLVAVSINNSTNSTTNGTTNSTTNSTTNGTTNSTANSTTNGTTNTTNGTTPNTTSNTTTNTTVNPPSAAPLQKSTAMALMSDSVLNNLTTTLNKMPGSRVFFHTLSGNMLTFDRLQFYYFHRHNLSVYSFILLSDINALAFERGSVIQGALQDCSNDLCKSINGLYDDMVTGLNYKQNYTDSFILSRNEEGLGFFANNLDFFFYELPFSFIAYLILSLAFRTLFNYRISKYLRKYAFSGIFLFIIYEGNVEQFAFYFFSECKTLFSINFSHKIANVIMIYFFFLMLVFSIGGLLWFFYHYRKLVKYFMEDSKQSNMEAIIIESLERSVYPLIFGCVHALFLDYLGTQTIILGVVEFCYFMARIYALRSVTSRYKFKVCMFLISSLLRMCFIVTFYLYESAQYPEIINNMHYELVWIYIICWAVELFHDILLFLTQVFEAIKGSMCDGQPKKKQKQNQKTNKKVKKEPKQQNKKEKSLKKKQQRVNNHLPKNIQFQQKAVSCMKKTKIKQTKDKSLNVKKRNASNPNKDSQLRIMKVNIVDAAGESLFPEFTMKRIVPNSILKKDKKKTNEK